MHSSSILPISLLCAVAQAGNLAQHSFRLARPVVPANTCSATGFLSAEKLCIPETVPHKVHYHQHHHHHNGHDHFHHPPQPSPNSHKINLDDLFEKETPWTHTPECVPDKEKNQTYCVYTAAGFANGRGVSIFTTPEIAKQIASLPVLNGSPLPPHVNNFAAQPYEIRNIPGKGNGIFATRRLERGDIIQAETPVGIYMCDAFFPDYDLGYEYLRKTYDWLPERTREEFEKLSMHKEGHPIMERVNTNAFAGEFGDSDSHFLVHPQTAMMNHDCRPNAMYHHDAETLVHTTRAATTIEAGEEITITYINLLDTHAERHNNLQVWGFNCTCNLCSASPTKNLASDARISQILRLQEVLGDWSPSSSGTPELAEKLIKLYEKERLHSAKGTGHMFAALAYNALGEEGKMLEMGAWHAQRALEAGMLGGGEMKENRDEVRALIDRPKKHWSWGVRRRQ